MFMTIKRKIEANLVDNPAERDMILMEGFLNQGFVRIKLIFLGKLRISYRR